MLLVHLGLVPVLHPPAIVWYTRLVTPSDSFTATLVSPNYSTALLQALEKYNIEKDIAAFIKKEFDKKYNPTWHCIVGRNFGARGISAHNHNVVEQNLLVWCMPSHLPFEVPASKLRVRVV